MGSSLGLFGDVCPWSLEQVLSLDFLQVDLMMGWLI
jgi:hypothetical protein